MNWSHEEAVALCIILEAICPPYGCHVALTGGCLYKDGKRKDCDLLFYRIRQMKIKREELLVALSKVGLVVLSGRGWCLKAVFNGKPVDCFFPDADALCSQCEADSYYGVNERPAGETLRAGGNHQGLNLTAQDEGR